MFAVKIQTMAYKLIYGGQEFPISDNQRDDAERAISRVFDAGNYGWVDINLEVGHIVIFINKSTQIAFKSVLPR